MSILDRLTSLALAIVLLSAGPVAAGQSAGGAAPSANAASAAAATQVPGDDDAALQPAEPDFRLISLPTTLRLPRFKGNFDLTHRFAGNLRRQGTSFTDQLSSLFGIDQGATVGFEYRFAVARHLQAAAYRTTSNRTIQVYGKYDAVHQRGSVPLSASALVSIEGTNNLQEQFAPAIGVSLSRMIGDVAAVYLVPMWVHNSAAQTGIDRDTALLGFGGRIRFRPTTYLAIEVSPRLSGYAPGKALYGFAIEKRAGGHMFQLNFTNGAASTFAQTARGGQPQSLSLGFNLSRKFF